MKSKKRSLFLVVGLAAAAGFNVPVALGQVACGDMVAGKVAMTTDLTCVVDPGVTVLGGGSVDMAGHQLTACAGCTGVELVGQGAKLSNGSIVGSAVMSIGVALNGSGVHQVENVTVSGTEGGFFVNSSANKLRNCTAYGVTAGFYVVGNKNAISRSHSSGSASANFSINGDNNNLTENTSANGGVGAGISVNGGGNKLSRNASANDNGAYALGIIGNGNKLSLNVVSASTNHGVGLIGNENKVSKTAAINSGDTGIYVVGNLNKLSKNAVYESTVNGIEIQGDGNNLNGSNSSNNVTGSGINITMGNANSLGGNVVMHNGVNGVLVATGVTASALSKTVALGNTDTDLQDDNANCGTNVWQKSVFRTSEANSVPSPACIQ